MVYRFLMDVSLGDARQSRSCIESKNDREESKEIVYESVNE